MKKLPFDLAIFSPSTIRCSAWSQTSTNGSPVAASLCAISFSWCGKMLSTAPVWMSKCVAEVLHAHRRALDVPARAAPGPRAKARTARPACAAFQRTKSLTSSFSYSSSATRSPRRACARSIPESLPYAGKGRDPEVDRALRLVGVAALQELRRDLLHLGDVVGRPRVALGALEPEPVDVAEEELGVLRGEVAQRQPRLVRAADRLVVDVGEVHDLRDPQALRPQVPPQDVLPEEGPQVPDVDDVVDRRPARVEPDVPGLERLEVLDLCGRAC